uniref:RhuM family protein n=1 Tax=Wolbachia endosymbiont of Nomada panzeri TaxID=1854760 RepID=UPI001FDF7289
CWIFFPHLLPQYSFFIYYVFLGLWTTSKPNMGLTNWRKAPKGKIFFSDTQVAKNEIAQLNRIVNMYIDYAEFQAARGKVMYMKDWKEKLDAFLKFNEQDILQSYGKVSHEVAITLATKEYEIFRKTQDKSYKSNFDKLIEEKKSLDQKSVKAQG